MLIVRISDIEMKEWEKLSRMMDGHTGIYDISKIFADKCETLYNSVSYDNHDMDNLKKEIDSHIEKVCPNGLVQSESTHYITVKELKDAVGMLKLGKKRRKWVILKSLQIRLRKIVYITNTAIQ